MRSQRNVVGTMLAGCLGLGLLQAEAAFASTFKVDPIQVVFAGSARSTLVTVTNQSEEALRFEVTAFAWDQSPKGEIRLAATEDIVFFPKLFTIDPGKEQKIRVGTAVGALDREKTYRIFVEELRPLEKPKQPPAGSQVRVLTKMGIPIFLQPARRETSAAVGGLGVANSAIGFEVRNTGNVHFSLFAVRVVGTTTGGETVFDRNAEGWYVLAGGSRAYEMSLPPEQCSRLAVVAVEARTDVGTFNGQVKVAPGACAAPFPSSAATPSAPKARGD